MTSPADGSVLTAATPTFSWSAGIGVSANYLWVGNAPGGYDLFGVVAPGLSRSVPLPADGRKVYVRLWSMIGGALAYVDYAYATVDARAVMTSPANGATLGGGLVTFQWTGSAYVLWVGSTYGTYDLSSVFVSGNSRTVTLPTDGRPIYVTLYSLTNGTLVQNRYLYTAAPAAGAMKAQMISPANGAALTPGSLALAWNAGGGARQHVLGGGTG